MENVVVGAVSEFRAALNTVRKYVEHDLWSCGGSEIVSLLREWHQLKAQVESVGLHLVREISERGVPVEVGAVSTKAYLMGALTMSPREAASTVQLSQVLGSQRADTGLALAEGRISREQAEAIVEVLTKLPEIATLEQKVEVEALLLECSGQLNASKIRKCKSVLDAYLDPDGIEPREDAAKKKRAAFLRDNGDGTITLRWTDTAENMSLLQAALEPLSAPRPADDGTKDPRCPAQRRADALVDLVALRLRHGDLPKARGARPHLVVTIGESGLRNGHGLGITATGEHLSNEAVRRISCDADLTAIRLDPDGVPLSMGRTRRTVSPSQWLALVARDKGCVFPDCDRPPWMCDAHHLQHWSEGGPTDMTNLALTCGRHHDTVHHQNWQVVIAADGKPELIPPPWVDPEQKPRRNRRGEVRLNRG